MDEQTLDLRAIIGVLRRRFRLIISTLVIVLVLAGIVIFSLKPVYTASALVLVDTTHKNLLDPTDAIGGSSSDSAKVDSEVELAKSETVLLQVVSDLKLFSDPHFAFQPGFVSQAMTFFRLRSPATAPTGDDLLKYTLSQLRDAVSVQRRGLTFIIAVNAKSGDPAMAAKLANAVANAYINEQLQSKINSTLAGRDILQGRISDASAAVAQSEDAVDNFIASNIGAITSETGRSDLAALNSQIGSTDQGRQQLVASVAAAQNSLRSKDYAALATSLKSQAVADLEAQRQRLQASAEQAAEGSQTAIDLRKELDKVQSDLEATAQSSIGVLQQQVSQAQTQEADLRTQLRTNVLSSNLSSSTLTRIYELQQSSEIARTQYQTLLTRAKDLDQQAYLQVADSRLASEALPPDSPSFPNTRLLLILAGVGALGLGIGLAFLYENFVGGIVSEDQLRALVNTRLVLTVPRQREQRGNQSLADLVLTTPLSVFSESIRKVRVGLDQALRRTRAANEGQRGSVILVTSSAPNEGKTTTSLALARAYSTTGKTVLLIDCDLRKPSIHRQLGKEPDKGLIDYLSETTPNMTLRDVVTLDEKSEIGVVLGSRRSSTATDQLVIGNTFARLINAASLSFDIVVLDTPPIGPVVDGIYLAQFADATVFVVKWGSTSQPEVRSAMRTLRDATPEGVEIVSVLTQSNRPGGAYYGKYSGYYSEAAQPSE